MKGTEYRYDRAYTLAEMLFVMGLLSILLSVGLVEGSRMLRKGRQAAMDKMAETLYTAVQRNLTAAKLAGITIDTTDCDAYQETERLRNQLTLERSDGQWNAVNVLNSAPVYRLWTGHSPDSLEKILFQTYTDKSTGSVKSAVSDELMGGNWMIGFDPSSYSVFYVYFSPKDGGKQDEYFQTLCGLDETDDELEKLTSVGRRFERGALIGYYGESGRDDTPLDVPRKLANVAPVAPRNPTLSDPGGSPGFNPVGTESESGGDSPDRPSGDDVTDKPGTPAPILDPTQGAPAPAPENRPDDPIENLLKPKDTFTKETPFNTPDGADPEQAREINVSKKLYCWIGYGESPDEPIANTETLVTRLNCWVPGDSSAFATGTGPVDVDFTLTVRGVSSMKTAVFQYKMSHFGVYTRKSGVYTGFVSGDFCQAGTFHGENGWYYRYPVVLDSLSDEGDGAALHQNRPFYRRFGSYGLIPGEDLMLRFEVDVEEGVKQAAMTASYEALTACDSLMEEAADYLPVSVDELRDNGGQYDWLWRVHRPGWNEYPVCNSLFADAGADESGYRSPVRSDGGYVAKIAYGRHLRNLDASVSGIGADEIDWVKLKSYTYAAASAADIRAVQIRDIDFLDAHDAFAPITNAKLSAYDGGGHSVSNPRIELTDAFGVGLFGTLDGDGAFALSDMELRTPIIVAENLSEMDVGAFIGRAEKPVTLRNLTLTDPEIRIENARAANIGGVIGRTAADIVADNLKAVNLSLTNDAARTVGGVIGLAGANVTLSGVVVENPQLVGGAETIVGGLVGAASGDGCQVTILSGQLFMPESAYADRELVDVLDKWLVGGECVGGLIGYAAGGVTIGKAVDGAPSFAATVVNASAYAGGLAGRVDGALSVDGAWADCYAKAARIGGLAGQCGENSAFSHCYASGFALNENANAVAAGFAPNAVRSIRDAYSIFNFDSLAPDATRYGLAESSLEAPVNAFYACGDDVGGVGEPVDGDSLKQTTMDGFQTATNPVTNLYRLTREDFDSPYPFPTLDGQERHYNDYLVTVYEPVAEDIPAPLDEIPIPLNVEAYFAHARENEAFRVPEYSSPDELNAALASVRTVLNSGYGETVVKMTGFLGESLLDQTEQITFEGFHLVDAKDYVVLADESRYTRLYYEPNENTLSYDLNGGAYYAADGEPVSFLVSNRRYYEGEDGDASEESLGGVLYGQTLQNTEEMRTAATISYLPTGDPDATGAANTVSRAGYDFDGWEFYGGTGLLARLPIVRRDEIPECQRTFLTYGPLLDGDGYLTDAIGHGQSGEVVPGAGRILSRATVDGNDPEGAFSLDLPDGQPLTWDDIEGWDYRKIRVYRTVSRRDGTLDEIPTTLDKVLVTLDSVKMPDFDITAKALWKRKAVCPVRMEIYVQRPTDDWRKNTNVEAYTNLAGDTSATLPEGVLLGDAAQTATDSHYNDENRDRLYDIYKAYDIGPQSADAYGAERKPVSRDTYQDLLSEFFSMSDAGEQFASDAYLYGTDDGPDAGKLKCRQLYLNADKSGIVEDSGGIVYRLYFDRNVVSFKFVREAEYSEEWGIIFMDKYLETPKILSQIYGLYEEPLANGDTVREFNAEYGWLVYPMGSDNGKVIPQTATERLNNEQLMTLDRFSYDAWEAYELEHPDEGPYAGLYLSSCLRVTG